MNFVSIPLKGCTRIYITRAGDVGAQRGLTTTVWIANDPISGWLTMPFILVAAVWWLAFGDSEGE